MVHTGGFGQTLPVIQKVIRADEVKSCFKASYLCSHVQKFALHKNIRIHLTGDHSAEFFAELLLKIGDGNYHL